MNIKFSFKKLIVHWFVLLVCGIIAVSCTQQPPEITYYGIEVYGALELLEQATHEGEVQNVLEKIAKSPRPGFAWADFWTQFLERGLESKVVGSNWDRLVDLANKECATNSRSAFANLLVHAQRGLSPILSAHPACPAPLTEDIRAKVFTVLVEQEDPGLFVDFVVSEFYLHPRGNWDLIFRTLNEAQWLEKLRYLLEGEAAEKVVQVMEVYQRVRGFNTLMSQLLLPIIQSESAFLKLSEKVLVKDILDMLRLGPTLAHEQIDGQHWHFIFSTLTDRFHQQVHHREVYENSIEDWTSDIKKLGFIFAHLGAKISFRDQLIFYERFLRNLESRLFAHKNVTREYLDKGRYDLLHLWLRLRMTNILSAYEVSQLDVLLPQNEMEEALFRKLVIHTAKEEKIRGYLQEHCDWLEGQGILNQKIHWQTFEVNQLTQPGCVYLTGQTSDEDSLSYRQSEINMSFDSVLITGGIGLHLGTEVFDGSFIDLSSHLIHPDLPVELPLEEDHAVSFPLMLGIRVPHTDFLWGQGTYYFIYHYTYKQAHPGRPARQQPQKGFAGGDLVVELKGRQHLVYFPTTISEGGPGQKGVPPRFGGHSSRSYVPWSLLSGELAILSGQRDISASKPYALPSPSVRMLERLFEYGERDERGNINLYIEPMRLFPHLSGEQQQRIEQVCQGDLSEDRCWRPLTLQAAQELWQSYEQLCANEDGVLSCPPSVLNHILPRLESIEFIEPSGSLGPVNPDGEEGDAGQVYILPGEEL